LKFAGDRELEKKDSENIQHISDTLDEVLAVLKKPVNKFLRVLEIGGTIVSIFAILSVIDIIRIWIFGG
jgi:hypothetical protein